MFFLFFFENLKREMFSLILMIFYMFSIYGIVEDICVGGEPWEFFVRFSPKNVVIHVISVFRYGIACVFRACYVAILVMLSSGKVFIWVSNILICVFQKFKVCLSIILERKMIN